LPLKTLALYPAATSQQHVIPRFRSRRDKEPLNGTGSHSRLPQTVRTRLLGDCIQTGGEAARKKEGAG
jgi:hypothetical protein